ncbi:MAG: VanZ family protein [Pontiellaceae bacterium]|nr:VanZ family protein [Pontiellaceae bacterium]MBN2785098.1 VanZ family protein [Pontiellaceae bacterium]
MIKLSAGFYSVFIIALIVLADRGMLPGWMTGCAEFPYGDNVGHFILFGGLSMVCTVATRFKQMHFFRPLFLGCAVTLVFVTAEEFSQRLLPTRTFSLSDLFADYAGIAFLGQFLCSKWMKLRHHMLKCGEDSIPKAPERRA